MKQPDKTTSTRPFRVSKFCYTFFFNYLCFLKIICRVVQSLFEEMNAVTRICHAYSGRVRTFCEYKFFSKFRVICRLCDKAFKAVYLAFSEA